MMDAAKSRLIAALERVVKRHPDMRFGQLVDFLAEYARPEDPQATSNIDDDELTEACEQFLKSTKPTTTILQTTP